MQQNFAEILLAALQNPIFYPKLPPARANSRDKIYAAFYDFVLSAQHFIATETMHFRRVNFIALLSAEQAPFKFCLEAHF